MPSTLYLTLKIELDGELDDAARSEAERAFAQQLEPKVSEELLTGAVDRWYPAPENATPDERRRWEAWGYGSVKVKTAELRTQQREVWCILRGLDSYDPPEIDAFDSEEAAAEQHRRLGGEVGQWTESMSPVLTTMVSSEPFASVECEECGESMSDDEHGDGPRPEHADTCSLHTDNIEG